MKLPFNNADITIKDCSYYNKNYNHYNSTDKDIF